MTKKFLGLKAVYLNCSIKKDKTGSHTQYLLNRSASIMETEGVEVEHIYVLDYQVAFGMLQDGKEVGQPDDWPELQKKIMAADILVIGTPIWLGNKSSVATQVVERMYAFSGESMSRVSMPTTEKPLAVWLLAMKTE